MNAHNYCKLIIVLGISIAGILSLSHANTVSFSGADFHFSLRVDGDFRALSKEDKVNQLLSKFLQAKGDLTALRELYDDTSREKFDAMIANEQSKTGFLKWLDDLKSIRARALIKRKDGRRSTLFLHLNEGTSAQIVMQAEIANENTDPKLVLSNITYPKGGTPEYWIVHFWNAMPALDPLISNNALQK